ncbi:MAG: 1,4-alpha-glucan branching enzyme [Frankiaceae bacterium]|nr:1,4-alpha-glucan branching enzyme [Frankiaceae bacterium]
MNTVASADQPATLGTCCVVLHSHLPWLAHAGTWPVGEEWLYQAWADSYLPLTELLLRRSAAGHRSQLTLGVTPVLAAMLDDPYCLDEFRTWVANWAVRADGAVVDGVGVASDEARRARAATVQLETDWSAGASPVLRRLADAGVVEILGGPATHPFLPLLDEPVARAALETGLQDATVRLGRRPSGIWAPECAYRPGLEELYRDAGVTHFLVDGPTVGGRTGHPYDVAGSGVVALARDLDVSYRVWSPTAGYPGGLDYRDFHTWDHPSGLKPARVTGHGVEPEHKAPYDPAAATAALACDVDDFVGAVVERLAAHQEATGAPGLVVVAYDTELFGHWWREGPQFLEAVLDRLPAAGVRLATLDEARRLPAESMPLPAGSWGAGKDWHIWTDQVHLTDQGRDVARRLTDLVGRRFATGRSARDPRYDQLAREALLTLSSDWAFLVSHGSSPDYASRRADEHAARFAELADVLEPELASGAVAGTASDPARTAALVGRLRHLDGPFGTLDARTLLDGQRDAGADTSADTEVRG